jgi:hypothetical protein
MHPERLRVVSVNPNRSVKTLRKLPMMVPNIKTPAASMKNIFSVSHITKTLRLGRRVFWQTSAQN